LLNLREEYRQLVVTGDIGNSQAFEMSRVTHDKQDHLFAQIRSGKLGSYNKMRSYVDGLIELDQQDTLFALQTLSVKEKNNIAEFEGVIKKVEKFVGEVMDAGRLKDFKKAAFHSDVSTERLDFIIQSLQKVRKSVFAGEGIQSAMKDAA
ncbi:MAG: hypothetical protein KAJ10_12305, partial [Thermodesulfovibrionia bacterium]|nr:hypothetical protein [Thermodesulfovibrionia bacterium]